MYERRKQLKILTCFGCVYPCLPPNTPQNHPSFPLVARLVLRLRHNKVLNALLAEAARFVQRHLCEQHVGLGERHTDEANPCRLLLLPSFGIGALGAFVAALLVHSEPFLG